MVSFAKEPYKRDNILQKRPIILSVQPSVSNAYVDPVYRIHICVAMCCCSVLQYIDTCRSCLPHPHLWRVSESCWYMTIYSDKNHVYCTFLWFPWSRYVPLKYTYHKYVFHHKHVFHRSIHIINMSFASMVCHMTRNSHSSELRCAMSPTLVCCVRVMTHSSCVWHE